MALTYHCRDTLRRDAVRGHPVVNGIDFLEVVDASTSSPVLPQTTLLVHLINDLPINEVNNLWATVTGGDRIRTIQVTSLTDYVVASTSPPVSLPAATVTRVLVITVDQPGDFSTYTLRLILKPEPSPTSSPRQVSFVLDPILSAIAFSFKVSCPKDFDCQPADSQPAPALPSPVINYLAKDYASFRQVLLDRMALLLPDWQERNPADLGIALVELMAYAGDYLSYQQDAIATEAYLHTARKRTSVRRHARLVDYRMHDGCNARVWVQVQTSNDLDLNDKPVQFLTSPVGQLTKSGLAFGSENYQNLLKNGADVFELMHPASLFAAHNEIDFYAWGDAHCCLPVGSTQATLIGDFPNLAEGQMLLLAEICDPQTGLPQDANLAHRQVVRLVKVESVIDPLGIPVSSPASLPKGITSQVTNITWHPDDALTFPLCISSPHSAGPVSRAFGNLVLADHGRTVSQATSALLPAEVSQVRFRPQFLPGPLTRAAPYDAQHPPISAKAAFQWAISEAVPVLQLSGQLNQTGITENWNPKQDLLASRSTDRVFVVETETDGQTFLRFGNDMQGIRPVKETHFQATIYRLGNGTAGNVGADRLTCLATQNELPGILRIWNPLPAQGGTNPETIDEVRQKAPWAFQQQERAVTPIDYENMARRVDSSLQRTACTFRWTGSWRTVFLAADRLDGQFVDNSFRESLKMGLERYRMAGYDLDVNSPVFVPLELEMVVCVNRDYIAAEVKQALLAVFTRQRQPNGEPGLFHPDQFTFGQTIWLSLFYAAAQAVAGVASVQITVFQRQNYPDTRGLTDGKLTFGRREIAQLDNDPNFPDRGTFNLILKGGH